MDIFSPFCSIERSCDKVLQWTQRRLSKAGLHVIQTFDLHTARHALDDCPCPHHGTGECDCQMLVLLVYGEALEPATLILHGNDGQTWLSIAETPNHKINAKTAADIKQALKFVLQDEIN